MLKRLYGFLSGTLRGRLILGVAIVHAVMMALFIADLTMRQRAMFLDRQIEEATALSQALSTSSAGWIASHDLAGLQELVDAQRHYPELLFAMLTDENGLVLADSDNSRQGLYLLDLPHESHQTILTAAPSLVDVATPARIEGQHVGWVRIGIGQRVAGEKLASITRSGVLYALAAIVIGSFIAWLMGKQISRRLYSVQETIDAVRSGNRSARSSLTGSDEAAVMAREFNEMLDAVAERDAELHESEEKYRGLIGSIQAAVVVHGADTRIRLSNDMARRLLGLTEEEIAGKAAIDPTWHFYREDGILLPAEEYPVNRVLATGRSLRDVLLKIHRQKDGDDAWVLVNADPVFNSLGELEEVIVTFFDISDRRRAEEALHIQTAELEQEVAERQRAQEALQEKAILLEMEIRKRQKAQEDLEQLNEQLEERVNERTAELKAKNADLEKMNKIFVGRELRMVELKEKIRKLEKTEKSGEEA